MSKTVKISILLILWAGVFFPFFAGDDKADGDKKKTRVSADNFTYKILKGEAVYEGEVFVDDSQIDIFADKMTIIFIKGKPKEKPKLVDNPPVKGKKEKPAELLAPLGGIGGNIDRIICEGNVIIVNKKDKATATGSKAVYTAVDELMVITGNAKLRTKAGVLSGKVIEYNRRTGDLMAKAAEFIKEGKEEIKPGPKNPKGK